MLWVPRSGGLVGCYDVAPGAGVGTRGGVAPVSFFWVANGLVYFLRVAGWLIEGMRNCLRMGVIALPVMPLAVTGMPGQAGYPYQDHVTFHPISY